MAPPKNRGGHEVQVTDDDTFQDEAEIAVQTANEIKNLGEDGDWSAVGEKIDELETTIEGLKDYVQQKVK